MYLHLPKNGRKRKRNKTARSNAKRKAKDRRRVNGAKNRPLGRRLKRNGG